ncbi:MAG: hypothetical protein LBV30_07290, partial [Propionibacteriaceae bacterium]|nr:hypothetical protein [Propionibacteriaceae bacterium]
MAIVSVIGLGAMGAAYAAKLSIVDDVHLRVIAAGARADRLARDGVTVNGQRHSFEVVDPQQPSSPADLVIFGVKHPALGAALEEAHGQIGPKTIILSLLNGITSEAEIAQAYPEATVLLSITYGVDSVRVENDIHYSSLGVMDFGQAHNGSTPTPAVSWLGDLFTRAGLAFTVPADMVARLWWKWLVNTGVNQVTAILEAPYAIVQTTGSPAQELMLAAQAEVIALA